VAHLKELDVVCQTDVNYWICKTLLEQFILLFFGKLWHFFAFYLLLNLF
jgi:hypothetical protein